jgi:hypothetical protein
MMAPSAEALFIDYLIVLRWPNTASTLSAPNA